MYSELVKAEIKQALEEAYLKLQFAASEMDIIDSQDAAKIAKVRKQVLDLLQVELSNI